MEQNFLDEFEAGQTQASKTLRFVNLLIDTTVFYVIALAIGVCFGLMAPDFVNSQNFTLVSYAISISLFLLYFSVMETYANGRTLGKMATGTRAVREDGQSLQFSDAFKRALSRIVPFEAFSGFADRPWHDSWTNTTVIKN